MVCSFCGEEIPEDSEICPYCGEKTGAPRLIERKLVLFLAFVFVFVSISTSLFYLLTRGENNKETRIMEKALQAYQEQDFNKYIALFNAEVEKKVRSADYKERLRQIFQNSVNMLKQEYSEDYTFGAVSIASNAEFSADSNKAIKHIDERIKSLRIFDAEIPVYSIGSNEPSNLKATAILILLDNKWYLLDIAWHA